jgi:hypothetical protein
MPAGMQLPQAAARVWTEDRAQRDRIVAMHEQEMPLSQMCDELGLGEQLDADGLRAVLDGLGADEVQAIRDAFVAEARAATGAGAAFPVDCRVDDPALGVRVIAREPFQGAVGPVARIEQS